MRFRDFAETRNPNEIRDELGWAEGLTLPELTGALMQALLVIEDQDRTIAHLEGRLASIEEKMLPTDGPDEDPASY